MMAQTPMMKLLTHLYRSTSSIDVKKAAIEPLINLLADSTYKYSLLLFRFRGNLRCGADLN
jgi:hypothetical protein